MRRLMIALTAAALALPLVAGSASAAVVSPAQPAAASGTTSTSIDQVRWYRHHHRYWRHHRRVYYRHHRRY